MRKRILCFFAMGITISAMFGCAAEDNSASSGKYIVSDIYPDYFIPIIDKVEKDEEILKNGLYVALSAWWDRGIEPAWRYDWTGEGFSCEYDETGVFNCKVGERLFSFDICDVPYIRWNSTGAAGLFGVNDKLYLLLHDCSYMEYDSYGYNSNGEKWDSRHPQILLIEFSDEKPEDYQLFPYRMDDPSSFPDLDFCYYLGNNIYFGRDNALAAIDLTDKEVTFFREEYALIKEYAAQEFESEIYRPWLFNATFELDDVTVYSAEVSECIDIPPVGMVFMACREGEVIGYMKVDFRTDTLKSGIEVKVRK